MANTRHSGFALLELLAVVVVLAILAGFYFNRSGSGGAANRSTYEMSVQRSHDAACAANRMAFRSSIDIFRMNNSSTPLTAENLQKAGVTIPRCPEGGAYTFAPDGSPVCAKHQQETGAPLPGQGQLPGMLALPEGLR